MMKEWRNALIEEIQLGKTEYGGEPNPIHDGVIFEDQDGYKLMGYQS